MKTVCLLEYPEQLSALLDSSADISKIQLVTASDEVHAHLEEKGTDHLIVSETFFDSQWEQINLWARLASISWFQDSRFNILNHPSGINIADSVSWTLARALVHQLRLQLMVNHFSSQNEITDAIVFDSPNDLRSINAVFKEYLVSAGKPFQSIKTKYTPSKKPVLKTLFRKLCSIGVRLFEGKVSDITVLAIGSWRHMSPLLQKLKRRVPVAFMDEQFQFSAYQQARREKIRYFSGETFLSAAEKGGLAEQARTMMEAVDNLRDEIESSLCFRYQDIRINGIFSLVRWALDSRLEERLRLARVVDKLAEASHIKTVVLPEDVGHFRIAAKVARKSECRVLVLSHGIPPVNYDWRDKLHEGGVDQTVVNSEFERDKYLRLGWDDKSIHVLGLPRYDYIHERLANRGTKQKQDGHTILYCPHRLLSLNRLKAYYLGIHTPGSVTEANSRAVIDACFKTGNRLKIKLHDDSDYALWGKFMAGVNRGQIELIPPARDIFTLINESDLIITTFSTVVIEAMLFNKSVITLNFTGHQDLHPYAERGIAVGVRSPEDLAQTIRNCLESSSLQEKFAANRRREALYFGGQFDGSNTDRVAEYVLELKGSKIPTRDPLLL